MRDQDTIGSNLGAGEKKRIKNFIVDVSNLNRYQKFLHYGSVKDGFDSLAKDFDIVMTELHFTMAVANEEQRKIDQFALESDIADMTKFLEKIGGGIIDQNQNINIIVQSAELKDPLKSEPTDRQEKIPQIIKKIYKKFEMTTHLVPKITKFKYSRMATSPTTDMKDVTDIVRWMAPEKLHDSGFYRYRFYRFYKKRDFQIKEHVLAGAGNREKSHGEGLHQLFKNFKKTWRRSLCLPGNPTIRASLQDIFINLNHLVDEYCTPDKEITIPLLPDKELDLDGFRAVSISDEAHTDLDNATAKYCDDDIADAQLLYAFSFVNNPLDKELGKKYLRLAALNNQPNAKDLLQKLGINVYTDI
ncbi:hypothetical protein Glove_209g132 [Diversispora epigaea]|uniref:Uncharacterized protein n=1 Tax=Diversispora epigaea TaxID=1348612 RepID=A0A397INR1_9GLOM|nr:hypothetical protein Glove_209g132 [Diversispora epigaea]